MKSPPDQLVATLAATLLTDAAAFEALARASATPLDAHDCACLRTLLHRPPAAPPPIEADQLGLGGWMALCQAAIFELLYHGGAGCLELVRSVAFGPYDWTQANALEVLCRLAVDGKLPQAVIAEIDEQLAGMRYETHLYLAQDLNTRSARDPRFAALLQRLQNPDFQAALAEIRED